ncbi:MAG: sigma-70 family RNA polymerase sigma factor [Planctomycetota bacterium]
MHADDQRVARAIAGDPDALEALVREATPMLRDGLRVDARWSRSFDVEDVVQVTLLEAFLRIRSLENATVREFHAWLRRIAEHNLIDAIRALESARRPDTDRRVTRGPDGESARTLLLQVADADATAGHRAAAAEQIARMHEAIARLPRSYRDVLRLVDLEQRSFAEAAAALERSVGAVHMLRSRAYDRLRELLRQHE